MKLCCLMEYLEVIQRVQAFVEVTVAVSAGEYFVDESCHVGDHLGAGR